VRHCITMSRVSNKFPVTCQFHDHKMQYTDAQHRYKSVADNNRSSYTGLFGRHDGQRPLQRRVIEERATEELRVSVTRPAIRRTGILWE
jgi:hypothetical protein